MAYIYKRNTWDKTVDTSFYIVLGVLGLVCLYPFWYVIILSLNNGSDAARGGIFLWPRIWSWDNLHSVVVDPKISHAAMISLLKILVGVPLSLAVNAGAAYALTRDELRIRRSATIFFFFTMLFSGGLIPFYMVLVELKLVNTFWVYIWPGLVNVWTIIVMRTSFKEIHPSVIESAQMDGANHFTIWCKLMLPLSKPMLAAMTLFAMVGSWNDWFAGQFFVSEDTLRPLQTVLYNILNRAQFADIISRALQGTGNSHQVLQTVDKYSITPKSIQMATVVVSTLPILVFYPFLQRYFVKGVMIGSIKG